MSKSAEDTVDRRCLPPGRGAASANARNRSSDKGSSMSSVTTAFEDASSGRARSLGFWRRARLGGLLLVSAASGVWLAAAAITYYAPDRGEFGRGPEFAALCAAFAALLAAAAILGRFRQGLGAQLRRFQPWSVALGLFVIVWQTLAAKTGVLPQPFFPPPHAMLEVFTDDYAKLAESVVASIKLELLGFLLGGAARLRHWRAARLVARLRLLGSPGHARDRAFAIDCVAAHRLLRLPIELERSDFPDRADHRLSGRGADLVGRRQRQHGLLRRRAHARRQSALPHFQGRDPGRAAACLRRPVHGARRLLRGAGRRRK